MKHQSKHPICNCNESIKNRCADNNLSILDWWVRYYRKYSDKSYREFLVDFNTYDVFTLAIKRAGEDFWKDSD
jgi:hypothetical protein